MHECRARRMRRSGHLERTTTIRAGQDVDLEHPLQPLRPCHRHVARGRGLVGRLSLAPASSGRRHLFTQPMVRREHAVVARKIDPWRRRPRALKLGLHILLLKGLDRMPIKLQLVSDRLDRGCRAAPTHVLGKALGVERIVGQEIQLLALHLATAATLDAPDIKLQIDPRIAARQVSHLARLAVVPTCLPRATDTAACFFERRTSVITRAFGSPKTPRTVASGRNPANA